MMGTESPARVGFEAIPRSKVYQEVAKQLERRITEELKPGDLLPPERELVQMLGVGTVVRSPGVTPVNPLANALFEKRKMIAELLDVRNMIEPPLVRRAAQHASRDDIADMEDILARQEEKVRRGELGVEEDSEFHYSIALASNNSAILKVVDVLMDLLRETRERSLQVEGRQEKSLAGHRRILAALKRGDAAAAEAAMRRHLQEMENIVLKKL
jgi:GntR family transcriptional repressor for pyruvate dehydrogenase complex